MAGRVFRVRPLGLSTPELNALKSVCALSMHTTRSSHHRVCNGGESADVFLVDANQAEALAEWEAQDPKRSRPVLMVDGHADFATAVPMRRPLLASRLLAALDVIAAQLLGSPTAANGSSRAGGAGSSVSPNNRFGTHTLRSRGGDTRAGGPATRSRNTGAGGPATRSRHTRGPTTLSVQQRSRFSVLVVDDSTTVRKQLELALREMRVAATSVASGEDALQALDRSEYDLVLLDVVMPGTDGYQVCKSIKKNRKTRHVPVVMLTSKSSPFDKIRGSLAGCDAYLVKPVTYKDFKEVVDRYLVVPPSASEDPAAFARTRAAG